MHMQPQQQIDMVSLYLDREVDTLAEKLKKTLYLDDGGVLRLREYVSLSPHMRYLILPYHMILAHTLHCIDRPVVALTNQTHHSKRTFSNDYQRLEVCRAGIE